MPDYFNYWNISEPVFTGPSRPVFVPPSQKSEWHDLKQIVLTGAGLWIAIDGPIGSGVSSFLKWTYERHDPTVIDFIPCALYEPTQGSRWFTDHLSSYLGNLGDRSPGRVFAEKLSENQSRNRNLVMFIDQIDMLQDGRSFHDILGLFRLQHLSAPCFNLITASSTRHDEIREKFAIQQTPDYHHRVRAFDLSDVRAYLPCMLTFAGIRADLFSEDVTTDIFKMTGGLPGKVGSLAERCLMIAGGAGRSTIDHTILTQAARSLPVMDVLKTTPPVPRPSKQPPEPPTIEESRPGHDHAKSLDDGKASGVSSLFLLDEEDENIP